MIYFKVHVSHLKSYTIRHSLSCMAIMNAYLAGGFMTGEITELYGPSGAGKSQICLAAAAKVAR